jgi:branched-subunit amino acid transport protein
LNALEIWIVIAGLTFVTLVTRSGFLVLGDRVELPIRVQRGLRYAPVCALMALIAPELALVDGELALSMANPRLLSGVAAGVIVLATRNMVLAMAIGMAVFGALRLIAA